MDLPQLLHTLTVEGYLLGLRGRDSIELRGPVDKLSSETRRALLDHKPILLQILTTRLDDIETAEERDAIQREQDLLYTPFPDHWDNAYEPIPPQVFRPLIGAGLPPKTSPTPPPEICFNGVWKGATFLP